MKLKLALAGAAVALAAATTAAPAFADITIGDVLDLQYWFPNPGDIYQDSGNFAYTGAGQSVDTQGGITTTFLADDQVNFTDHCGVGCVQTGSAFNGPILFDLTNPNAFNGWTVLVNNMPGSSAVLTGDHIGVNWAGLNANGNVVIGAGVPEPAAWTLMILGVGLAGASLRAARRTVTA
jgi:hypothetical protein